MSGLGFSDRFLSREEAAKICAAAIDTGDFNGRRVLVLIPDHTRSGPVDLLFELACGPIAEVAEQLDVMVALGTHPPMSEEAIYERVSITREEHEGRYSSIRFFNHDWNNPDQLAVVGQLTSEEIGALTNGLFEIGRAS